MKCPRCGSADVERMEMDIVDSGAEGDIVSVRFVCLRCDHEFYADDFVPRPQKEADP